MGTQSRKGTHPIKDKAGLRYFRLTVIEHVACKIAGGGAIWRCMCDCGNYHDVESRLLTGKAGVKSCGCILVQKNRSRPVRTSTNLKHGDSGTKIKPRSSEHITWASMIQRCTNPKHQGFRWYGGIGVTVCDRWLRSYEAFLQDMGRKPSSEHSIDRIDVLKGYEPGNCRWATTKTQQNNRTNNRTVVFNGERMTCTALAEKTGIPNRTMLNWLNGADTNDMTVLVTQKLAKRLAKVLLLQQPGQHALPPQ